MKKKPINNGGPAFPGSAIAHGNGQVEYLPDGMSLRDYFAAKAMQAFIADASNHDTDHLISVMSYQIADSMIRTRELKL